ncbi:MAG: response regulator transcription factor [Bacteroidales bacterium]|nr:response regulator transcription factor [Bacteroidales bacterium]
MMESRKTVILVIPSDIVARGLEGILVDSGEFVVEDILKDLSRQAEARLKLIDPDLVIIDPSVLDFKSRKDGRSRLADICDSIVVAISGPGLTEEAIRQYDGSVSLYDNREDVLRKIRSSMESRQSEPMVSDGGELSSREKEILVCVAKGMLNKEIADKLNLSIYTVITHRKNITRKTGIKTVAGLTVYALLNGLIDMSSVQ